MTPRRWRIPTVVLLLATVWSSPRLANVLVAAGSSHLAGKALQARGRNRVNPPSRDVPATALIRVARGGRTPAASSLPSGRRPPSSVDGPVSHAGPPARPSTALHLRC